MNIQNIKNETIHKLTTREIGALDLVNHGVYTYKGELKSRKKGYKTVIENEWQTNFVGANHRIEVIKIEQQLAETEYAFRCFNLETERYDEYWSMLFGCDFFK